MGVAQTGNQWAWQAAGVESGREAALTPIHSRDLWNADPWNLGRWNAGEMGGKGASC